MTILRFIFSSSVNPAQISLTLKGLSGLFIPFVMHYFNIDQSAATMAVSDFVTIISLGVSAYGLARKIYLTLVGENKAL